MDAEEYVYPEALEQLAGNALRSFFRTDSQPQILASQVSLQVLTGTSELQAL